MRQLVENTIENELKQNKVFDVIFKDFEIPKLQGIENDLKLSYESNEYMGYYKKDLYFDLTPKIENNKISGVLKLTFVANKNSFDIQKAMHKTSTDEVHIISATFRIYYNKDDDWDAVRYSYTMWKDNK